MPNLGFQELMIILLIAVILFGGKKIPEIGKGLGEGIKQFKNALKGVGSSDDTTTPPGGEKKQV